MLSLCRIRLWPRNRRYYAGACRLWLWLSAIMVRFAARHAVERVSGYVMLVASAIAIFTTIGIVLSLIFETSVVFQLSAGQRVYSACIGRRKSPFVKTK